MKAMIFAAGLGSRLNNLTRDIPKALVPVNGKPMLENLILRLISYNIRDIIINVHHFGYKIISFVESKKNFGINITFSAEDELLDTGGGIRKARGFFSSDEPFLVHNVDIISDLDIQMLLETHKAKKPLATLAVRERETSRYLLFNEQMNLRGWESVKENKKIIPILTNEKLKRFSFMGIQILSPEIFDYFPAAEKFSIIEAYLNILKNGGNIIGNNCSAGFWFDLGTSRRIKSAEKWLNENIW
jgi:NDP-sugar pyrophosphorylase family protein